MSKKYEEPKVEKIIFATEDVITTSGDGGDGEVDGGDQDLNSILHKIMNL